MSNFEVLVEKVVSVTDHPNADRLSIVKIRGYECISAKLDDGTHRYNSEDVVIYVPEDSIVPENILRDGFWDNDKNRGILSGKDFNRVKSIKLRGVVSTGILIDPSKWDITEPVGIDVAEKLGITKFVPEIPTSMGGDVAYVGTSNTVKFDIENIKKYNDIIKDGEEVVFTEKLHGTLCALNARVDFNHEDLESRDGITIFANSKGLGNQGIVFKNNDTNAKNGNVYVRTLNEYSDIMFDLGNRFGNITVFGEVFGKGVQDLTYGLERPEFRVFGINVNGKWINHDDVNHICLMTGLKMVPVVFRGAFSENILKEYTEGNSTFTNHIREGIVVKPVIERIDPSIGRVQLKSINNDYLLRKNGTEYN